MGLVNKTTLRQNYGDYYRRLQLITRRPEVKVSGLVSLTIFAIVFFSLLAILPTIKTIIALKKEIGEIESVNKQMQKKIMSLDKAQNIYMQIASDIVFVNEVLPDKINFEKLAWQIHWLASENGIKIISENFDGFPIKNDIEKEVKELKEVAIGLTINGKYENIRYFLRQLTRINRLISIEELTVNKKRLSQNLNTVNANISAKAYYLPN